MASPGTRLNWRAFFDQPTGGIEVEARARGWIPREIDEFPRVAPDALLTVDVARHVGKPQSVPGAKLPALHHAEPGPTRLRAVVLSGPENVTVAAPNHVDHAPGIVIVNRRGGVRGKARQHQRRAAVALPENGETGARIVEGGKPGWIYECRIGGERAQQGPDTGEQVAARGVLGQQVLGRAEELLETRLWRHDAIIRRLSVRANPGSGQASGSAGALPPATPPTCQGTGRYWRAGD